MNEIPAARSQVDAIVGVNNYRMKRTLDTLFIIMVTNLHRQFFSCWAVHCNKTTTTSAVKMNVSQLGTWQMLPPPHPTS